ncbi:hypothetical protein NL326_25740, partial [Klebsiella pneumoniae]|nr:hypothetical protein [Klebsiella pneumoniae]
NAGKRSCVSASSSASLRFSSLSPDCLDDWTDNLRFKKDKEMDIWINDRQAENPALTSLMDEYVCFAWRTTAEPLNQASSIVMQGI